MRQSCAHEHSEFEFLSALVTVQCRGFVESVSHLCQLLSLNCYHSRPDYPTPSVTCWCLANWQPFLPSVCCQMPRYQRAFSSPSHMIFFLSSSTTFFFLAVMNQSVGAALCTSCDLASAAHVGFTPQRFCG